MTTFRVKKKDLYVIILATVLFHVCIVSISRVHFSGYYKIQRLLIAFCALLLLPKVRIFLKKEYQTYNILLMAWAITALYASYINKYIPLHSLIVTIQFVGGIVLWILFMEYVNYTGKVLLTIDVLFFLCLAYCLMNDFLMVAWPSRFFGRYGDITSEAYNAYLVGNKFNVGYLHGYLITFCWFRTEMRRKRIKNELIFVAVLSVVSVIYTSCATVLLALCFVFALYFYRNQLDRFIRAKTIVFLAVLVSGIFFLFVTFVLTLPFVRSFITENLGRSLTLTGRTEIYQMALPIVAKYPWFGVGYDNNYQIVNQAVGYANLQTGVLDAVLSYGIVGVTFQGLLLYCSLRKGQNDTHISMYGMLYLLIVAATVEITFRTSGFVGMSLIAFTNLHNRFLKGARPR